MHLFVEYNSSYTYLKLLSRHNIVSVFLSTCAISIHVQIWRSYVSILTNPLKYKLQIMSIPLQGVLIHIFSWSILGDKPF
jgi:hypothetical protein